MAATAQASTDRVLSSPPDTQELPDRGNPALELDQIRVYLIREDVDVPDGALREERPEGLATHHVDSCGIRGYLVVARPRVRLPGWVPFLRNLAGIEIEYQGNRHLSAVLFVQRGPRVFALTFGFGRHLLSADAIEPEFGLRTAAGLIDPDAIASVDSRAFEATVLQVRRQSSRGTGTRSIGFDVGREMLRALAGQLLDENLGTRITGSDSLGLTATLSAEQLGPRLDAIHASFSDRRYRRSFEYLDRWHQLRASDPERVELDEALVSQLAQRRGDLLAGADPDHLAGQASSPILMAPQIIEYSASGFLSSVERDTPPHAFPNLDAYLKAAPRPPTLPDLRRNHDLVLMAGEPFAIDGQWPIYHALTWQVDRHGETYVLVEGVWWKIDAAYRQRIDARLRDIPESALVRPAFDPIEDEADYNIRLASEPAGERALIDRLTARFADEEGGVEPCDVLTLQGQFIHVKRMTGSSAMSHMLGQGLVAARLFAGSVEFRDYLRRQVAALPAVAARVPQAKPSTNEYGVVFGIISKDPPLEDGTFEHVALSLPFFTRNFLFHVATEIEGLGYLLEVARIPVVPGARPAAAGPVLRIREGVDARPNRWGSRSRRRRRAATNPLPAEP